MFPGLSPKPLKGQPSFIKFIQDKLLEEQLEGTISNEQQAVQFIESMRGEIESMYNQNNKNANWYSRAKTADASSASEFGTGGRLPGEGSPSEWDGVKTMIYRDPGSSAAITVGDRYRSKGVGVAFEPGHDEVYKIVSKGEGHVVMEDSKGKKRHVEIGVELPAKYIKV